MARPAVPLVVASTGGPLLLLLLLLVGHASSEVVLPLDARAWTLANENGTLAVQTSIPAYPIEVLRSAGVIGDPLYRYGELESRWVAMETWTFSTAISTAETDALLQQAQVVLQLDGVDTYADVLINGDKVFETVSFHRQFTVPVKGHLVPGKANTLAIAIKSAYKQSLANKAAYPYFIPTLYNTGSIGAYNFARKPAFDFGWDWGPALAASGIHGSVKLMGFSAPTLDGASVVQTPTADGFKLAVTANFMVPPVDTKGFLTVSLPELKLSQQQELAFSGSALNAAELTRVKIESEFAIDKASVQLWWPAGGNYGPHKLYDVVLQFTADADGTCSGATELPAAAHSAGEEATEELEGAVAAAAAAMDGAPAAGGAEGEEADELGDAAARTEAGRKQQQQQYRRSLLAQQQAPVDPTARRLTPDSIAAASLVAQQQQLLQQQQAAAEAAAAAAASSSVATAAVPAAAAGEPQQEALPQPLQPPSSGPTLKDLFSVIGSTLKNAANSAVAGASDAAASGGSGSAAGAAAGPEQQQQCSVLTKRVGFRTIELVMQPLPEAVKELFGGKRGFEFDVPQQKMRGILNRDGAGQWANDADGVWRHFEGDDVEVDGSMPESFYFRVNGVPIFMKGANVIPMSVIPSNTTTELIEATLQAAVDSNQNMLRVWGGGLYHPEAFYNFCDENGLLIWQDAMFGGSHYPRTPEWLANYADEITQQAARLSWHPSVALWCGNNEIDLSYEWSNSTVLRSNRNMFVVDYQAVFIDTVRKNIKQVNPNAIFVDSSPFKGAVVDTPEMYVKRWGWIGDPRYGTIHSYNYVSDCEDFRSYPLGKFVSEFGWQSYPLPETYAAAMDPERDWGVGNPMNEFRNRRTDVTPQFLQQYAKHFNLPKTWNPEDPEERMRRFRSYLWIGNMQHARCYETALNFWRRLRSNAQSLTMGVMYWQLNDIWAGASWSSIDVAGRWKPVHYAVKRAYAPLAVQAVLDGSQVQLFVVSDLVGATSATVTLRLISLTDAPSTCGAKAKPGGDASAAASVVGSFDYSVPGLFATRVWKMGAAELLKTRPGCTAATCYLSVTLDAPGVEQSESQLWFSPFKALALPDPAIAISDVKLLSPIEVALTVRSTRPAALVMLSAGGGRVGHFTDNAFNLDPCAPRTVTFVSHDGEFTAADLRKREALFSAESLFDHSSWAADVDAKAKKQQGRSGTAAAPAPATKN